MKISCIYIIKSIVKPEKFYIGSAVDYSVRKYRHFYTLRKGKHINILLQNHYNKYGVEDLDISILETVRNPKNLIEREQYFIDTMSPTFNICKIAGNTLGTKRNEEAKNKLSECRKKYKGELHPLFGKKRSDHTKYLLRVANLGKRASAETKAKLKGTRTGSKSPLFGKTPSKQTREKMSQAKKGVYDRGKSYKAVKVINIQTNEIYDCIKTAAEVNNIVWSTLRWNLNKPDNIYMNLKRVS